MNPRAYSILDFWFVKTSPDKRFKKDEALDLEIKNNFIDDYNFAKSGDYEDWLNTPKECLALIILFDQFSRNLFRDMKEAFDQDHKARLAVNQGIYLGHLQELNENERLFFLLPLIHSEELIDHERAYALLDKYLNNHPDIKNIKKFWADHTRAIEKFRRYPHRNKILGRQSTSEEIQFLNGPNSSW
tara:strand:+ start:8174 stop:8734 length:561 start_codon:yes stop_codon:yes gene_type:complete